MTVLYLRSQQAGQSTPGSGTYRGAWQASQTWASGDRIVATNATNYYVYECTTGGAGTTPEPTWTTTPGNTTADGAATFTCRQPTTWANATITMARMAANDAAGDIIYVRSDHSESTAAAVSLTWSGTTASPTRIICVSDTGEPPTTTATGAVCATTGASDLTVAAGNTGVVYFQGIRFKAGDSTSAADIISTGYRVVFQDCAFELAGNNSGSDITANTGGETVFNNCTFKSANSGSTVQGGMGARFVGCSIESGGTPGNPFFNPAGQAVWVINGFDFSNLGVASNLCSSTSQCMNVYVSNAKMPSSWSGSINSSTPGYGSVYQLMNSDSADTNYRLQRKTQFGEIVHETTIKRTGGASDGTTGLAWKMVSNADAEWNHQTLDSPEIVKWNETTGSSVTATVEFVHDSTTNMTDKEIWLEVMYLGTSGVPLGSFITDAAANYLSSAADQTDSSEAWTTTGLTNPNTQKLSVSFTPQEKGFVHAVVKVAAASKTVYIDPVLTLA